MALQTLLTLFRLLARYRSAEQSTAQPHEMRASSTPVRAFLRGIAECDRGVGELLLQPYRFAPTATRLAPRTRGPALRVCALYRSSSDALSVMRRRPSPACDGVALSFYAPRSRDFDRSHPRPLVHRSFCCCSPGSCRRGNMLRLRHRTDTRTHAARRQRLSCRCRPGDSDRSARLLQLRRSWPSLTSSADCAGAAVLSVRRRLRIAWRNAELPTGR